MDRSGRGKENNPGGRPLHTYTPRSHEDLLRSHLQLDASRNARLQNELQRLADENKRLRDDLDDARKGLKDRDNEIDDLRRKLREQPERSRSRERPPERAPTFEIDGKPLTLDQIINHFEGVIQKHHDLLARKNQQIQDLENQLKNRPNQPDKKGKHADTQTPPPREDIKTDDFAKELALIRKEYEQVEYILTERNNKLEQLIEDLKRKLDQYADEIGRLRQELATKGTDPNENTLRLLREKEKENDYLKDLINSLKNQPQNNFTFPDTTNEELENEIKKIIVDKQNAVRKLSNMIIELKKTPSGNVAEPVDTTDVEKECNEMMRDLNKMSEKLNYVLQKLQTQPQAVQGEPVNKGDLLNNLEQQKKQNEDQIDALKNLLKGPTTTDAVVLTGLGRVKIDDPEILKRKYPDGRLPDEPVNVPSHVEFYLYPLNGTPVRQEPPERKVPNRVYDDIPGNEVPIRPAYEEPIRPEYDEPTKPQYRDPTPESSLKSYRPVKYTPITPEESYRNIPIRRPKEIPPPPQRLYPEIPSETRSIPPKPQPHLFVHSPFSCEACQDDYIPKRQRQESPPPQKQPKPEKPKKKGCCGGKGSATSNVPYEKPTDKEEVVYIHQPDPQPKTPKKSKSKPDNRKRDESREDSPENTPKQKRKLISQFKSDTKLQKDSKPDPKVKHDSRPVSGFRR